jgi:transcriptional regulator with XRE-family HTH domain
MEAVVPVLRRMPVPGSGDGDAVSVGHVPDRPDPCVWEVPLMRAALGARDVRQMYRLLQRLGYSQQRIAALAGQSQPEVSAILHGRRVMAYDVLSRIADGLGIPRGYMGLAYTAAATPAAITNRTATESPMQGDASRPTLRTAPGGGVRPAPPRRPAALVLAAARPDR